MPLAEVWRHAIGVMNGWHGYSDGDGVLKQWFFIADVEVGYVERIWYPGDTPSTFSYSFANKYHGGFATGDEAKAKFKEKLIEWWVDNEDRYHSL